MTASVSDHKSPSLNSNHLALEKCLMTWDYGTIGGLKFAENEQSYTGNKVDFIRDGDEKYWCLFEAWWQRFAYRNSAQFDDGGEQGSTQIIMARANTLSRARYVENESFS